MKQLFFFLLFSGPCALLAQDYEIRVQANQVVPSKRIFLEFINGRGQAVKIDSMLPNAKKEVLFKGKVLDQGGFYLALQRLTD